MNYLDFDYQNETLVSEEAQKIRESILKVSSKAQQNLNEIQKTNLYDNIARKILETLPDNWDSLNEAERTKLLYAKLKESTIDIYKKDKDGQLKTDKNNNLIKDIKKEKELTDLAIEFYKIANAKQAEHKNSRFFLLAAAATEDELAKKAVGNEKMRHKSLCNYYSILANYEFDIEYRFRGPAERIQSEYNLNADNEIELECEEEIEILIAFARATLNNAKSNNSKSKIEQIFTLDDYYGKLTHSQEKVDELDKFLKLQTKKIENENTKSEEDKIQLYNKIEKLKNKNLVSRDLVFDITNEKEDNTAQYFFKDDNLSPRQKLERLDLLRIELLLTRSDIKDFLIKGDKEITASKTNDGKIEIKISNVYALDKDFSIDKNGARTDTKTCAFDSDKTLIFNPLTKSLEGFKIGTRAYLFNSEKNFDSKILENLNTDLNLFIGNLENEFNIDFTRIFNKKVPILHPEKFGLNVLKSKEKIKYKTKNITINQELEAKLGNVEVKSLVIKPSLLQISGEVGITKGTKKLALSFNSKLSKIDFNNLISSIKDNIDASIAAGYIKHSIDKNTFAFGESYSSFFGIPIKWNGKIPEINLTKNDLTDEYENCKTFVDELAILLCYAKNTPESKQKIKDIISNNEELKNAFTGKVKVKDIMKAFSTSMCKHINFLEDIKDKKDEIAEKYKTSLDKKGLDLIFNVLAKSTTQEIHKLNAKSVYVASNEEMLKTYLNMNTMDKNTQDRICDLIKKVDKPEQFYSDIRTAQNICKKDSNILNTYNLTMNKRIKDIIESNDIDEFLKILSSNNFDKNIIEVLSKEKSKNRKEFLDNIKEKLNGKDNKSLEELIDKFTQNVKPMQNNITNTEIR